MKFPIQMQFKLPLPSPFAWSYTQAYLSRSRQEKLFFFDGDWLYRKLPASYGGHVIRLEIDELAKVIRAEILDTDTSGQAAVTEVEAFIKDWLDLETDLPAFYAVAQSDPMLGPVVQANPGLRITGVPDLLECMAGTILGQQVNTTFATTLKNRLIDAYGITSQWKGHTLCQFPAAETLAALEPEVLRPMSISQRKAEYVIGFARLIESGEISKEKLSRFETAAEAVKELVKIRGVGVWTANYILLRCLRYKDALPLGDSGLHNAVRDYLGMDQKPTNEEVKTVAKGWKGWEAYATYYLWYGVNS
ncbi:MAG: DNA-3-methyladenine glycosylase [Bacteroidota bacterium]